MIKRKYRYVTFWGNLYRLSPKAYRTYLEEVRDNNSPLSPAGYGDEIGVAADTSQSGAEDANTLLAMEGEQR